MAALQDLTGGTGNGACASWQCSGAAVRPAGQAEAQLVHVQQLWALKVDVAPCIALLSGEHIVDRHSSCFFGFCFFIFAFYKLLQVPSKSFELSLTSISLTSPVYAHYKLWEILLLNIDMD